MNFDGVTRGGYNIWLKCIPSFLGTHVFYPPTPHLTSPLRRGIWKGGETGREGRQKITIKTTIISKENGKNIKVDDNAREYML